MADGHGRIIESWPWYKRLPTKVLIGSLIVILYAADSIEYIKKKFK